jgi:hypothetical protein
MKRYLQTEWILAENYMLEIEWHWTVWKSDGSIPGLNPTNKNSQFWKLFCKNQKILTSPNLSQKSAKLSWRFFASANTNYMPGNVFQQPSMWTQFQIWVSIFINLKIFTKFREFLWNFWLVGLVGLSPGHDVQKKGCRLRIVYRWKIFSHTIWVRREFR